MDQELKTLLSRVAEALDRLAPAAPAGADINSAEAYIWHAAGHRLEAVPKVNRVDLDLRHPLAADARVHLSARLWHRAAIGHRADSWVPDFRTSWPDFGARYDAWADLREACVQWDTRWGRLTLGRDIAQWGALELQSPLRILNPVDFGQGFFGALGSGDTLAMADWMARLSTPIAGGSWEWIVQPFFTQHRFSPFATDVSFVRADLGPTLPQALFSLARRADLRLDRVAFADMNLWATLLGSLGCLGIVGEAHERCLELRVVLELQHVMAALTAPAHRLSSLEMAYSSVA